MLNKNMGQKSSIWGEHSLVPYFNTSTHPLLKAMAYRKCSERSIDAPKESLICYPTLSSISFPPREPANFETSCPHPMPIYTIPILQRRKREPEKLPIHSIRLLLPPILPTRTIHTSLRLQKKHNQLPPPLLKIMIKNTKHTFSLILFLQNLHFTVFLITASLEAHVYTFAMM